jgi:polyhydroxyalkanoate synthesis regulator phasin
MNLKLKSVAAATVGALLFGFGANAMADSTFDLVQALVAKGVLTEEEALPLLKGREADIKIADEKVKKKAKVGISDAIDNATVYGDVRVRYEARNGEGPIATAGPSVYENRNRGRYKITLGVKTESGDWYTDLALAMGANGRSDNATFGKAAQANINDKETLFIKRAVVGWKATDWLTLEAGRMNNPLYTTPMVWDADLNFEGLAEKVSYKWNDADFFATAAQAQYQGDRKNFSNSTTTDTITTELFAFQGGVKYAFNDHTNGKAALTYSTYNHNTKAGAGSNFTPGLNTQGAGAAAVGATVSNVGGVVTAVPAVAATSGYQINAFGVNDLDTIEIPAEFNYYMNSSSIGFKAFGDYVYNTSSDERYNAAIAAAPAADRAKIAAAGNDDIAWMLGVGIGSAADFKSFDGGKMAKGDWSARIWYQDVGVYSVDPNAVDSDFMDSRVNTQGVVLKTQYNVADNVYVNFAYGHAKRKNGALGTAGAANDIAVNWNNFDLYQLDLTYKF